MHFAKVPMKEVLCGMENRDGMGLGIQGGLCSLRRRIVLGAVICFVCAE